MRNFYFYLAGAALLASGAEMVSKFSGDADLAKEAWVTEKKTQSGVKAQERVPFARVRKRSGAKALLAPGISATNTYAITNNTGPAGASAGDELEYTVVITNSGPDPANGTVFTETIDANTTLVPGTVKASPIAQNDNYNTIGNVNINIPAGSGLLANDISPSGTALSVNSATNFTTANGGVVAITAATGAFTYQPAAGYIGDDTFNYEIQNGSGMTSTATVTITVGNGQNHAIWFINAGAAAGGNGTLSSPFNSLTAFQSINDGGTNKAKDGHVIFVYSNGSTYNGNITVRNNQRIFGQGASASLLSLTGFAAPSGADLLPATGGSRPTLGSASGDVLTFAGTGTIRGFNIGASAGAKIAGSGVGTLTVSQMSLSGNGSAINISGKTLAATFDDVSSSVSAAPGPIKISGSSGSLTIGSGTLTASNTPALDITGVALNVVFNAVNANGGAKGISLNTTTGSLQITGSGTTAGSGGTIQNITQRGIELINASNITLKNINLINANTNDGTTPSNQLNGAANAAVHADQVSGLTMDRVIISGTVAQEGINLRNSSNFNFSNGSVASAGQTSEEGCIYAINTSGTNSIVNSTFSNAGGRVAYFSNTSVNMTLLTIDNSTFQDSNNSGLQFFGYGSADMKLKIQNNSRFLRNPTVGVYVGANNTAVMQAEIKNSTVDIGNNVGRSFDMAAAGSSTLKFNITNNTGNFRNGIGCNLFAFENGYLEGNVIGNTFTNNGGSGGVSAIVHSAEGANARGTFLIQNNTLTAVDSPGIYANTTSSNSAQSNMHVDNNTITVTDSGSGDLFYGLDLITSSGTGNNAKLCTHVTNNKVTKPAANIAYRARSGTSTTTLMVQGTGGTIVDVWNSGANTPVGSALQGGSANPYQFNQTCPSPSVSPLREAVIEEPVPAGIASVENSAAKGGEKETVPVQEVATAIPAQPAIDETIETVSASPARTEAALAGETVTVNGSGSGFVVPANKSTTIKFRVTINNNIPASVCQVSTQGTVSGSNFTSVLTDDPAASGTNNPTVTPVVSTPVITFCPGDQVFSPDAGTCTSTQTFTATADGCPAPTITYTVGGNPITFPYAFPAGETTVLVTASNGIGTAPTCSFKVTVTPTPAPPITDQPDAATICAASGTSFTVATSQTGVTYQWQKKPSGGSFENITTAANPTADDPTLTLSNVSAADNLSEYRCIITNPCNSTTSEAALLTVNQITASSATGTTTVNQGAPAPNVTFGATGGTLPYTFTYKINNGSNLTVSTTGVNTTATVSQPTTTVGAFTYELVTVTDAQNCTLTPPSAQTATVTVANDLTATISGSTTACENETQPVITFTAVNGIAPFTFTYQINGGADQQVTTTGASTTATVNVPTSVTGSFVYSLTNVSGAGGATTPISGQTATVNVNAKPTIALSGAEYQCDFAADPQTYTVFFTATPGAVITTDKGTVNGSTVTGVPSKETAIIVATLNGCSDTLTAFKDCSMPVTLIDFSGAKMENTIALKWNTAEETNSDHFDIQRSADGRNWATIGVQKSRGESYAEVNYNFVDQKPAAGDNYYRLKMVDADATFAYSKIIKVGFENAALVSEFYPNPVSDVLNLKSTDWGQVKSVELHSLTGLSVYKSGKAAAKTIDVKNLPVGMYILTITHKNGEVVNRKVLINR